MIKLNTKIRRNEGLPPFEENNLMRNTSFLERTRSIIPRFRQTKSSCLRFFVFHYKSQDYKHQKLLFCFYAERQNVPPFLPFLLGMPLYKGVEAREGFLSSLPSPSRFSDLCLPSIKRGTQKWRVTGGIFRFPPVCEPQ